ncbi:MAG: metallophosphoesterase [Oscillospiraceae bacterium]|nr:metallophosphoesterase [Oscillospiraceae bacterium]
MKVLLVSDVESKYIWDFFDKERFKDIELIISCGDLKSIYLSFLVTMINAPLIYVRGNHDEYYITNPPEGCQCIDGTIFKFNNLNIVGFGGSYKYNNGVFQYTENEMRNRYNRLKRQIKFQGGIDILVTHAPAFKISDGEDLCHTGFQVFNYIIDKYRPKYFFHGHQHLDYNANLKRIRTLESTTIVNSYDYYIIDI